MIFNKQELTHKPDNLERHNVLTTSNAQEKHSKLSILLHDKTFNFFSNSQLSNWQREEVCTFQGAAWQGLDQSQVKVTGWSSCRSKDNEGQHVRVQNSNQPKVLRDLEESQLACMSSTQKQTRYIWFGH